MNKNDFLDMVSEISKIKTMGTLVDDVYFIKYPTICENNLPILNDLTKEQYESSSYDCVIVLEYKIPNYEGRGVCHFDLSIGDFKNAFLKKNKWHIGGNHTFEFYRRLF